MLKEILTVSDVNKLAKIILEKNSPEILCVEGEISNITYHMSGHLYFTIKDEKSTLKVVVFNCSDKKAPSDLKHGDSVKVFGRVTIYEQSGQYQMLSNLVEKKVSYGELYKRFLLLKEKLTGKGYFDLSRKRDLPIAFNIGIVTSETGAVIRDIVTTAKSRFENINLFLYPSQVQGTGADLDVIEGINFFNSMDEIDLIIIGRGGGSFEDLNAFNSELLADVIYSSKKPIISAVGHETDFVISDFVADVRAATPTQAAVLAVVDKRDLVKMLDNKLKSLNKDTISNIERYKEILASQRNFLTKLILSNIKEYKTLVNNMKNRYIFKNFIENIQLQYIHLSDLEKEVTNAFKNKLHLHKTELLHHIDILKGLNPLNILSKGYAVLKKGSQHIYSVNQISNNDSLDIKLCDGDLKALILEVKQR